MLMISRKEVVDIFVTETVRATVQCWTVRQLRAVDFLCWFVFFGTILEKSLHFFLSCTCTADAVMALQPKNKDRKFDSASVHRKYFTSHSSCFGGSSVVQTRETSVCHSIDIIFFFLFVFLHCDIITVELGTWCHYWAVSTPRSEQQSGSSVLYLQVLVLVSVLCIFKTYFKDMLTL